MNRNLSSLRNTGWRRSSRQPGGERLLKRHRSFEQIQKDFLRKVLKNDK